MNIVFQSLQITSNYCAAWSKNKKHIILFKVLSALFNSLAIISVGNFVSAIPVLFTIVRTIVCFYKEKFKTNYPIWLCILGYMLIGLLTITKMQSFIDVLPLITSLIASLIIWYCNPIGIKVGLSITDTIWLIYYIQQELYLLATNIALQTIISAISIVRILLHKSSVNMEKR